MKYLKEAKEIIDEYREEWMSDNDWQEFLDVLNDDGFTAEIIAEDLEKGVKNGYEVDVQLRIAKDLLRVIFKYNGYR